MPDQITVMPFGRHRGRPLTAVDAGYLAWCLRECRNLDLALRAAIEAELARRGVGRLDRPGHRLDHRPGRHPDPDDHGDAPAAVGPAALDRRAVFALLTGLLAAGVRVVARGDGAVHLYAAGRRLSPELRARLSRQHTDLDGLACWARWESPGVPRATPAAGLLSRLRRRGVVVSARPGGLVEMSLPHQETAGLVDGLTAAGRRELWFRVACNLPDAASAAVPTQAAASAPLNALAGLHRHFLGKAAKAHGDQAGRWRAFAGAVAAMRAAQAVPASVAAELASHCRRQVARAGRRGQVRAVRRWGGWAAAVARPPA